MNQSPIPTFRQKPGVTGQQRTRQAFQRGINQIVQAVRPTLGPIPRLVAVERGLDHRPPELLDNGGVIARRIIDLPDRDENAGAMLVRGMLWRVHEEVGDGTATAAVLYQAVFNEGLKYITAGGNAMRLRHYLEQGAALLAEALNEMARPVSGAEALRQVAQTVCYDAELGRSLGEIFALIGEHGMLEIRAGHRRETRRKFVEGSYWPGGLAARSLLTDPVNGRTQFEDTAVLLSNLDIEKAEQLTPIFRAVVAGQIQTLVIVAHKFSEQVLGLLTQSLRSGKLQIIGVKTPGLRSDEQMDALEDMAVLTGGRQFLQATGDTFDSVTPQSFGRVRRLWVDMEYVGIVNGQGAPRQLRRHVARLRHHFDRAENADARQRLQARIGRLLGGSASLDVGGFTESEMAVRKELAGRAAAALRGALRRGVLPGGGSTLLACRPLLQECLHNSPEEEERAACRILRAALAAPFCAILENSGRAPAPILSEVERAGPGYGFDAARGKMVNMEAAGIWDVADVTVTAVTRAIYGAALALTVDAIVHRRKPPVLAQPDAPGI